MYFAMYLAWGQRNVRSLPGWLSERKADGVIRGLPAGDNAIDADQLILVLKTIYLQASVLSQSGPRDKLMVFATVRMIIPPQNRDEALGIHRSTAGQCKVHSDFLRIPKLGSYKEGKPDRIRGHSGAIARSKHLFASFDAHAIREQGKENGRGTLQPVRKTWRKFFIHRSGRSKRGYGSDTRRI